ncbi:MAG: hypothetical protein ABJ308_11795 [Halieaceae bacterium]
MEQHPAIAKNKVAVITGAAGGIGLITDSKRIAWSMGDVIENRPPLSRWHPDYAEAFEAHMAGED